MKSPILLIILACYTNVLTATQPFQSDTATYSNKTSIYPWELPEANLEASQISDLTCEIANDYGQGHFQWQPISDIPFNNNSLLGADAPHGNQLLICYPEDTPDRNVSEYKQKMALLNEAFDGIDASNKELDLIDAHAGDISVLEDDNIFISPPEEPLEIPKRKPLTAARKFWFNTNQTIANIEKNHPGIFTHATAGLASLAYFAIGKKQFAVHHLVMKDIFLDQHLSQNKPDKTQRWINAATHAASQFLVFKGFSETNPKLTIAFLIGLNLDKDMTREYSFFPLTLLLGAAIMDGTQHPLMRAMYFIQGFAHFKPLRESESELDFFNHAARATKEGRKALKVCHGLLLSAEDIESTYSNGIMDICPDHPDRTWQEFFFRQALLVGSHIVASHFTGSPRIVGTIGHSARDFELRGFGTWLKPQTGWQPALASYHHGLIADSFADDYYDYDWSHEYSAMGLDLLATAARAGIFFYFYGPDHAAIAAAVGISQLTMPRHVKQHIGAFTGMLAFHTPQHADIILSSFAQDILAQTTEFSRPTRTQKSLRRKQLVMATGKAAVNYFSHLSMFDTTTTAKNLGRNCLELGKAFYDTVKEGFWTLMGLKEIYAEAKYHTLGLYNETVSNATASVNDTEQHLNN